MIPQFISFAIIGAAGFFVDSGVLLIAIHWFGAGPYLARSISFLVAVTFTWAMNRTFTFRGMNYGSVLQQWMRFVSANMVGALLNLGVYAWSVSSIEAVARQPVFGVALGSIVGLAANFFASKKVVFRRMQ